MNTTATNRKVRILLSAIRDKTLEPQPEFQRRLVWSNKHKQAFLETVLMNLPFPEIYVAAGDVNPDTGAGFELLVDGQQRLMTLYQYFHGSDDLVHGPVTPYSRLPREEQLNFLEYEVVVRDLGRQSLEQIKEVFRRINATKYSLNAMEIHNARFDGALKHFAEEIAVHDFFEVNRVFQTTEVRRMADVTFALTVIITKLSAYFNRDDELEEYLRLYNDEFGPEEEVRRDLVEVFSFIAKCDFPPKNRAWKKADLLTLIIETDRLLRASPDAVAVDIGERLKRFYQVVDDVVLGTAVDHNAARYYRAALQATNDRSSRLARAEVLRLVMSGRWPSENVLG